MKMFLKILKYTAFAFVLVVAGFFFDRAFVSYYKVETPPVQIENFNKWFSGIFKSGQPISREDFLRMSGENSAAAENFLLSELGYSRAPDSIGAPKKAPSFSLLALLMGMALEDRGFALNENGETSIMTAPFYVRNASISRYCERPYDCGIFVEFSPQFEGGRRYYADFTANSMFVTYRACSAKIDFPILVNGESLWKMCGLSDNGMELKISASMKERLLRRIGELEASKAP